MRRFFDSLLLAQNDREEKYKKGVLQIVYSTPKICYFRSVILGEVTFLAAWEMKNTTPNAANSRPWPQFA